MSTVNNGPQIVRSGLVLDLDAGNGKSYSTNRFQSLGSGTVTENVTFAINGTGTFQRVATGTVIGGYTIKPNDVVYSYALGVTGCHYHGNTAPIPSGVYATFSVDYLITGATNIATSYPNNVVLVYENYGGSALSGSTSLANNYQNIWQRLTLINGPTAGVGTQAMFLYPGFCSPGKLADSGTIYFRNPKVEWTNVDTGNSTFNSTSNIGLWYDLSGNGNNGTLIGATGGPTSNVSNKGNILFDGVDDYVSITNVSSLRPITELTIEMVVKAVTTTAGWNHLFGINPYASYSPLIFLETGGQLIRALHFVDGVEYRCNTNETISTSVFKHVVFTFKPGDAIRSYFNGVASTTASIPNGTLSYNTSNAFLIGYLGANWPNVQFGLVRMYNKALTQAEVSQNYQATKTRFGL
jgi:hypothetical protein